MPSDNELHPERQTSPLVGLLPVWRRIQQAMAQRLSSHGVPLSSAVALLYLNAHEEEYEPAQLADKLLVPRQTTTFILDSLESKRLARRRPHPVDRRRKVIQLTARGRQQAQLIRDDLLAYETSAANMIFSPDEAACFRNTVTRLADAMEELNRSIPTA